MSRSIEKLQHYGTAALIASTVVVGASIALDGQIGRLLNGTGGLIWFGAAAVLATTAKRSNEPVSRWLIALGLTATVAFVAKPTDLLNATLGLGIAGGVIAAVVRDRPVLWATLIPALYLPAHIGTAVLKVVSRNVMGMESSIRSDPPPTAAVVPFVMVVAAVCGGWMVSKWRDRPDRASVSLR